MWWCKLHEAILRMVGARYEIQPCDTNFLQFERAGEVAMLCPLQIVRLDPMVGNVILDNAVTEGSSNCV